MPSDLSMDLLNELRARLPKHHFKILRLRYVEMMTYTAIAKKLGIGQPAASKAVKRALQVASAIAARKVTPAEPVPEARFRAKSLGDVW